MRGGFINPKGLVERTPRLEMANIASWIRDSEKLPVGGTVQLLKGGEQVGSLFFFIASDTREGIHISFDYLLSGMPVHDRFCIEPVSKHFGGYRYYYLCICGSRTTALYLKNGRFRCRHCHDLTYLTSQKHRDRYLDLDRSRYLKSKADDLRNHNHPRKANAVELKAHLLEMAAMRQIGQYVQKLARRVDRLAHSMNLGC